jgi:hypothetical protein
MVESDRRGTECRIEFIITAKATKPSDRRGDGQVVELRVEHRAASRPEILGDTIRY